MLVPGIGRSKAYRHPKGTQSAKTTRGRRDQRIALHCTPPVYKVPHVSIRALLLLQHHHSSTAYNQARANEKRKERRRMGGKDCAVGPGPRRGLRGFSPTLSRRPPASTTQHRPRLDPHRPCYKVKTRRATSSRRDRGHRQGKLKVQSRGRTSSCRLRKLRGVIDASTTVFAGDAEPKTPLDPSLRSRRCG